MLQDFHKILLFTLSVNSYTASTMDVYILVSDFNLQIQIKKKGQYTRNLTRTFLYFFKMWY